MSNTIQSNSNIAKAEMSVWPIATHVPIVTSPAFNLAFPKFFKNIHPRRIGKMTLLM